MKKLIFVVLLFMSPMVTDPEPVEAGACYSPAPYCNWPMHPLCICDNYGTRCWWVCAK